MVEDEEEDDEEEEEEEEADASAIAEVYRGLYLGSAAAARNRVFVQRNRISCILNVTESSTRTTFSDGTAHPAGMAYKQLPLEDVIDARIDEHWAPAFQFLTRAAQQGRAVLVHCTAGRSRSAAIVVAWAMHFRELSLREAWEVTVAARRAVRPNIGFLMKLMELERSLLALREQNAGGVVGNTVDFFDNKQRACRRATKALTVDQTSVR